MKTAIKWLNHPFLLCTLLVTFLVTDLILVGRAYDLSKSDWAAWVGSVGTVLTLVGTIWLATSDKRQRDRESRELATLTAGALLFRIVRMKTAIDTVLPFLVNTPPPGQEVNYNYCADRLADIGPWTNDELLPLIGLKNQAAAKLALVVPMVAGVQQSCEIARNMVGSPPPGQKEFLVQQLRYARAALEVGQTECARWARQIDLTIPD